MRYFAICSILLGFLGIFGYTTSSGYLPFGFSNQGQKNEKWCYAAATELVFDFYQNPKCQTQIVQELRNATDCSAYANCGANTDTTKNPCNSVLPSDSLEAWLAYLTSNTKANYEEKKFSVEAIKTAITTAQGPVIVRLNLNGDSNHAVVINGFYEKKAGVCTKIFGGKDVVFFSVINPGGAFGGCTNCKFLMQYDSKDKNNHIKSLNGNGVYGISGSTSILVPTKKRL